MTIMYNNMAGCQRRHTPIKLATYCNHKIIFNINILTKKHQKEHKTIKAGACALT